jgi:hypothetical protein
MKVKLFVDLDDSVLALVFKWDEDKKIWICEMDDDFMKQLGALPMEEA